MMKYKNTGDEMIYFAGNGDGVIIITETFSGLDVTAGGMAIITNGNDRVKHKIYEIIGNLIYEDIITPLGVKGELFQLTTLGYVLYKSML